MSETVTQPIVENLPRKVKNMDLAEDGRKAIGIAEKEMPGLMSTRQKYGPKKPLQGKKVTGSLHMTVETAVLISDRATSQRDHGRTLGQVGPSAML